MYVCTLLHYKDLFLFLFFFYYEKKNIDFAQIENYGHF